MYNDYREHHNIESNTENLVLVLRDFPRSAIDINSVDIFKSLDFIPWSIDYVYQYSFLKYMRAQNYLLNGY